TWVESVAVNRNGTQTGLTWPGWVPAIAARLPNAQGPSPTAPAIQSDKLRLTFLDNKVLAVGNTAPTSYVEQRGFFKIQRKGDGAPTFVEPKPIVGPLLHLLGEVISVDFPPPNQSPPQQERQLIVNVAALRGNARWQLQCRINDWFPDI